MELKRDSYLIINNISKKKNIGNLVRSASAFGIKEIIVVSRNKFELFGAHGSNKHIKIVQFFKLEDAVLYLKERNVFICGIEILPESESISSHPFRGSTAFMLGNEGVGLSDKQIRVCDHFVYIPQYGQGTASLNVTVAGSIIMHHFALWANFKEALRQKDCAKYVVDDVVVSYERDELISKERKERKEENDKVDIYSDQMGLLFE